MKKPRIDKLLSRNETVLYRAKMSKAACIGDLILYILSLLVILGGIYVYISLCYVNEIVKPSELIELAKIHTFEFDWSILIMCFVPIATVIVYNVSKFIWVIRDCNREAIITDERVLFYDTSFFHDYTFSFKLSQIKEVFTVKPFIGKMFNYGNIYIGTGNGTHGLDGVKNYLEFESFVEEQVKLSRQKNSTTI